MQKEKMRHIEGLRALAIIFIMLFHLNQGVFPCGYLGVEVFLVIFGYFLVKNPIHISRDIILKGAGEYAAKKLRRLYFPVSILIAVVLSSGFIFFTYEEWKIAAKTGLYTMLFFSNEYLDTLSGNYFAQTTDYNPLFHLWYISVTMQVLALYVCYNILTYRLSRISKHVLGFSAGVISLILFYQAIFREHSGEIPYYQTLPRLWDVMAGSCIAIAPSRKIPGWVADLLSLISLVLICMLMSGTVRCDFSALLVVVSCGVLLYLLPHGRLQFALGCKPAVFLGSVSFSLYLVHVPVYVWYRCFDLSCGYHDQQLMFILALAAGCVFHYLVVRHRASLAKTAISYSFAFFAATAVILSDGFRDFINQRANAISDPKYDYFEYSSDPQILQGLDSKKIPSSDCVFELANRMDLFVEKSIPLLEMGDKAYPYTFLLLGDSYAQMMYFGINEFANLHKLHGVMLSHRFPIIRSWDSSGLKPDAANLLNWLKAHENIETVIIGQSWKGKMCFKPEDYKKLPADKVQYLRDFLKLLKQMNKKVVLITQLPLIREESVMRYVRRCERLNQPIDEKRISCTKAEYDILNYSILPTLQEMENEGLCTLVHIERKLEQDGKIYGYKDGKILYHDSAHVNPLGSILFTEGMKDDLIRALLPQN